MTTYSGTITSAASTTAAATAIRTQMQTTIPSNDAWTLVESTTMNSGAVSCDVYKCSAAQSGMSADWYLAVMQSADILALGVAEGYNTATHKPQRPIMKSSGALQTLQADGGVLAANTELDWWNGTSNPGGGTLTVATTYQSFGPAVNDTYIISVAKDAVALWISSQGLNGTAGLIYGGTYDSIVPDAATYDPLPLLLTTFGTSLSMTVTAGWANRTPMRGGQPTGYCGGLNNASEGAGGGAGCFSAGASSNTPNIYFMSYLPTVGGVGGSGNDDFDGYFPGGVALRIPIANSFASASATSGRDKNGFWRGYLKHVRVTRQTGVRAGDACSIDGIAQTCALINGTNLMALWFETNPA